MESSFNGKLADNHSFLPHIIWTTIIPKQTKHLHRTKINQKKKKNGGGGGKMADTVTISSKIETFYPIGSACSLSNSK